MPGRSPDRIIGSGDLVAVWEIKLHDGPHRIEFEHGTTSGKRILRVDGRVRFFEQFPTTGVSFPCTIQELRRRNYQFKLVGNEQFDVSGVPCVINIDAAANMRYVYSLEINGQSFDRYRETTGKSFKNWTVLLDGITYRITLDAESLDLRVNGTTITDVSSEFTDEGSQLNFVVGSHGASIQISTANFSREGLNAKLLIDTMDAPLHPEP